MTPEALRDIYHEARLKAMVGASDYGVPVIQDECDLKGWKAVIEVLIGTEVKPT